MKRHIEKDENGSIAIESAIIIPGIILFFLVCISVLQCVAAQNVTDRALFKTADFLSRYALLYNEFGLEKVEDDMLGIIEKNIRSEFSDYDINEMIYSTVDIKTLAESADDYAYMVVSRVLFNIYLLEDDLYKNGYVSFYDLSFTESEFFNKKSDDIVLRVVVSPKLPISGLLRRSISIKSSICVKGWVRGDYDKESSLLKTNIWELSNFERGNTIRKIFGGDLPYDYPVIASFIDGKAIMIKSIDHTAPSYSSAIKFEIELRSMADKLSGFRGTEIYANIPPEQRVGENDIKERVLIVVIPENLPTLEQSKAIMNFIAYCSSLNVTAEIKTYMVSAKYQ